MAKMLKGVVDDGTREIPLVNKFGKLICNIYIRPADFSILDRYKALMGDFAEIVKPLEDLSIKNDGTAAFEQDWAVLKSVEAALMGKINELFDMDEAADIFRTRNPFSSVGGEFFCLRVLTAIGDVIASAVEEEAKASKVRTDKYLRMIDKEPTHAGAAADNA